MKIVDPVIGQLPNLHVVGMLLPELISFDFQGVELLMSRCELAPSLHLGVVRCLQRLLHMLQAVPQDIQSAAPLHWERR